MGWDRDPPTAALIIDRQRKIAEGRPRLMLRAIMNARLSSIDDTLPDQRELYERPGRAET